MLFLVFSAVLGPLLAKKPKARPVDDECDDYQAKVTNWRTLCLATLGDDLFRCMALASWKAKGPIIHFLNWGQQAISQHNAKLKVERTEGVAYLGPSFLSRLVTGKYETIQLEISNLLTDDAKPNAFGELWKHVP